MIEEIKKEIKALEHTTNELRILGLDINIDYVSLGRVLEILDKYNNQEKQTTIFIDSEDMNRFIWATGNGQSQCYNCGTVNWDSFMFKDTKFNDNRVCSNCKKLIEQGKPETKIKWKNFIPKYRLENKLEFDKEVDNL